MSYADLIKAFRTERKLTHQQFADAVGVSRGAVQQWEKGETAPTRNNQPAVARYMGISVSELMSDTGLSADQNEAPITSPLAISTGQHTLSAEALTLGLLYDRAPISDPLKIQLFRRVSEVLLGIERPASSPESAAPAPAQTPKKSAA